MKQRGVTLIELLIGLTIIGILFALAMPSYRQWIQNVQIRTAAESIQNGLRLAKAEAVRRNTPVRYQLTSGGADWTVCLPATPTTCPVPPAPPLLLPASIIQVNTGTAGSANALVGAATTIGNYATPITSGTPAGVTFSGLGRAANAGDLAQVDITNSQLSVANGARWLVVTVSPYGQIRMCDPQLQLSASPQGCQ